MFRSARTWLVVGITIIGLLAAISIPKYKTVVLKSKETVLKDNLFTMRRAIDQYTKDKQRPPTSLQDLVDAGYFRQLPVDPMTNSNSSWKPIIQIVAVSPGQSTPAVTDLRSGAAGRSSDGTAYGNW